MVLQLEAMALLGSETWCDIVTNLIILINIIIICSPNEDLILFFFLLLLLILLIIIIVLRSMSLLGSEDDDRQGVDQWQYWDLVERAPGNDDKMAQN